MINALTSRGGYLCNGEERAKLRAVMWPNEGCLNPKVVARSAPAIAEMAGLSIPDNSTFFMVLGEKIGPDDPFSGEKISPVLTLWKFGPFSEAIEYVENITKFCGYGHSCGIHSFDEDRINELGLKAHVSRMMVRQPQSYGNSGDYFNGMPFSLSLGCGTWGRGITCENITWKHFLNYTWVSRPIEPVIPDEEQIFGAHWKKYGR